MNLPAVRRCYAYPCADLVTLSPSIDLFIDNLVAPGHRGRVRLVRQMDERRANIIVLGFPRSGNTFLTAWLREVVGPLVNVVDGRSTHSALDVHRSARAGYPVVVPTRPPIDTCASMMLRAGKFDQRDYAEQMLRAYRAWYVTVEQALGHESVAVITFDQVIEQPAVIAAMAPVANLIDSGLASSVSLDDVATRLRVSLAEIPGQGSDQDGVEARLMVSLPDPSRARESQIARNLLLDGSLADDLERAQRCYEAFLASAAEKGRLANAHAPHDSRMK